MKIKVHYDTDEQELCADDVTLNGVAPYDIAEGMYAYYEIEPSTIRDFEDALEDSPWCYFSSEILK